TANVPPASANPPTLEQPPASAEGTPGQPAEAAETLPAVVTDIHPVPAEVPSRPAAETVSPPEPPAPAVEPTPTIAATSPVATVPPAAPVVAALPPPPSKPAEPDIDWSALPLAHSDLSYVIVNEAGASDYSASPIAKEEFPEFDATLRGTISIGRRLQDPLSELVKIDPQHVG